MRALLVSGAKQCLTALDRVEHLARGLRPSGQRALPRPAAVEGLLIWSMDRIGDVVRATPALRALAQHYPAAHRCAVIAGRAAPVLAHSPHLHETHVVERPYDVRAHVQALAAVRQRRWQLGVLLECDPYWRRLGAWWLRAAGVEQWCAFDFSTGAAAERLRVKLTSGSWIDQFNNLAAALGAAVTDARTELFLTAAERAAARHFLHAQGVDPDAPYIVIHPGGNFLVVSRQWPPESYAELITRLRQCTDAPILVTGLREEGALIQRIRRHTHVPVINLAGRLSLRQLMAVLERAMLAVMNDTGPLHLANALRVPTVAILGPTGPEVVGLPATCTPVRLDLPCSPCAQLMGWQRCRNLREWECLRNLSVAAVYAAVQQRLDPARLLTQPIRASITTYAVNLRVPARKAVTHDA